MSSTARSDDWKKYDKNLNKSVALEDLRDSVRQQDEEKVEKAIERCRNAGLQDNEKVKEAVEIHLPVISARNKLRKACKELKEKDGDDDEVKSALQSIKKDGLSPYLQQEVRDAKNLLERHEKSKHKDKPKAASVAIDAKMVAEIRRYQNPPPVLRTVIQGALLLVGEDEDATESWKNCQRLCNPYGNDGLSRRMISFDPSKAHPEIVARAKQILHEIEFSDVQAVGRSAPVSFYVWAMGSIEKSEAAAEKESKADDKKQKQDQAGGAKQTNADNKMEKSAPPSDKSSKADEKKEKQEAKPANRKRQKEIFGRLPPQQDTYNFYSVGLSTKKKSKVKTDDDGNTPKPATDGKPSKTKTDEQSSKPKTDEQSSKPKTDEQSSKPKTDEQSSKTKKNEH